MADENQKKDSELSEEELAMVSGGDEAPKETITFEYGALQVKYNQQKPKADTFTRRVEPRPDLPW